MGCSVGRCALRETRRSIDRPMSRGPHHPLARAALVEVPSTSADAERACAYLIAKVRASSGRLFHQGPRIPPLVTDATSPALRFMAEQRLHRVSTAVARALLAWADGFPVELRTD